MTQEHLPMMPTLEDYWTAADMAGLSRAILFNFGYKEDNETTRVDCYHAATLALVYAGQIRRRPPELRLVKG